MKKGKVLICIIVVIGVLAGFQLALRGGLSLALTQKTDENRAEEAATKNEFALVKIAVVGDIMMHSPQMKAGYDSRTQQYDFTPFFTAIKPYLVSADLTLGNLETPLAGQEWKYTGYPMFNSPTALAAALKNSGFDFLTTANNHCLDRGGTGIVTTLDSLDSYGLKHTGTARSSSERDRISIEEIDGVKIAILAYTYGTNGIPVPGDKAYLVNHIDEKLISSDVRSAKELGADFIIACIHWGNEYQRQPNKTQKELAAKMIGWGVNAIIGSHPHVLQPAEKIVVTSEDGLKEGFVIYSLGNFISNQKDRYQDSGIILWLEIEKEFKTNRAVLKNASYLPTWVQRIANGKPVYRVLAVEQALKDYENKSDPLLSVSDYNKLKQVWNDTTNHLGNEEPIFLKSIE